MQNGVLLLLTGPKRALFIPETLTEGKRTYIARGLKLNMIQFDRGFHVGER